MSKQQYLIQKYVMASSCEEAIRKSRKMPIHEVYISNSWFEKVANYEFFREEKKPFPGLNGGLSTPPSSS